MRFFSAILFPFSYPQFFAQKINIYYTIMSSKKKEEQNQQIKHIKNKRKILQTPVKRGILEKVIVINIS